MQNAHINSYKGTYNQIKLQDIENGVPKEFPVSRNRFAQVSTDNFSKIPGSPVAYWVSEKIFAAFSMTQIKDYGFAGIGMRTGDNERFLRRWYEVETNNTALGCRNRQEEIQLQKKWVPYNKGGEFRKWYGNNEYVVNWFNDGEEIKENTRKTYPQLGDNLGWKISNEDYYFKPGITWSGVTSGAFSCRCYDEGFIFDSGANGLFANKPEDRGYLAGFLNTKMANNFLKIINPTINTGSGTLNQVPLIMDTDKKEVISEHSEKAVELSKSDWDSYETSWDFKKNPLV